MIVHKETNIFKRPAVAVLLALLMCFLWGSAFPAVKVGYSLFRIEDTGSTILFAGYRFFLAGILALVIVSVINKRLVLLKRSSVPYIAMQGLLQTTVQYVCFYLGLAHTTGAKGSIINGSTAFFSILAAHFILRDERITIRTLLGCIIGFMGVVLVNYNGESLLGGWHFLGEGMIIISSIAYGISSVTAKVLSKRESPNAIAAYQLIFGGLVLTVIGLALGGTVEGFTVMSTLLFGYLILIPAVTFCVWGNLLKYNPVEKITIFCFSISVFGVILSTIFLGDDVMNIFTLGSLALVSVGIIIVNSRKTSLNGKTVSSMTQ